MLSEIESRVIFLGFARAPVALVLGATGGSSPLADVRVRRAIYQAFDAGGIIAQSMSGQAPLARPLIELDLDAVPGRRRGATGVDRPSPHHSKGQHGLNPAAGFGGVPEG